MKSTLIAITLGFSVAFSGTLTACPQAAFDKTALLQRIQSLDTVKLMSIQRFLNNYLSKKAAVVKQFKKPAKDILVPKVS